MSQYPVNSPQGLYDAVNYLASGPSGLGQDFNGYTAYLPGYLTGNFRTPYSYITVQKTGSGVNAQANIQILPNTQGLQVGQAVTGASIGAGANLLSFSANTVLNPATYTANLSVVNTADFSGDTITFSPAQIPQLYVAPIACSSAVQLTDTTFQYNFAATQASPPFIPGNNIRGADFANDFYNGGVGAIGLIECTVDYCIFRTGSSYPGIGDTSTGNVYLTNTNTGSSKSTDCNSKVTTVNPTDRVFLSAQLNNILDYVGSGDLTYTVYMNRYVGFLSKSDPGNPIYRFSFDGIVSKKVYSRPGLAGPGTVPEIETIFSTLVDNPAPGYYWYIVEVQYDATGDLEIKQATLGVRSISTQVVKQ
jgi:hypothetical protein